ncbi:MAG TPA: hypothetical protein PKH33_05665 [bacterium]|nr:hypothetical protein [bacterium]
MIDDTLIALRLEDALDALKAKNVEPVMVGRVDAPSDFRVRGDDSRLLTERVASAVSHKDGSISLRTVLTPSEPLGFSETGT